MAKPIGYTLYDGPSQLDGQRIVVICTGFGRHSGNRKTGAMLQTWILRADQDPLAALNTGADISICGNCPQRGVIANGQNILRDCYVTVAQAPLAVWRAWDSGRYEDATDWKAQAVVNLFTGRKVRLGAYGDPAAAPERLWALVTSGAASWTGYTHQWATLGQSSFLRDILMASCDSPQEMFKAQAMGWRTFRVGSEAALKGNEVVCPASDEGGSRTSCDRCNLCQGAFREARNVVIRPHGPGAGWGQSMEAQAVRAKIRLGRKRLKLAGV